MPAQHSSILDSGYWDDESKLDANLSAPARIAKWAIDPLRPSFLTRGSWSRKPLGRTAYLDGLRGFAAFIVYWHHHVLCAHDAIHAGPILENAFGYNGHYYFACLPFVRTFFTGGHFAVSVFFVISGYVLSTRGLSLIQSSEYVKLGDTLASALYRRWLRLYIPVICTTFLYMTSWHAFGLWTETEHQSNYHDELWKWYAEFKNFSYFFNTGGDPWFYYNLHVWSIPVELKGSIVIYTTLLAFSRCTRNARLWGEVGLIFYFMYISDGSYNSMFVAGMLLCDLDLLAESNDLPHCFKRLESFKELIFYKLFIISMYLSGSPSKTFDQVVLSTSPGWHYLSFLKPQAVFDYKWFYLFWAAIFLVASTSRIARLKSFFETPFNQYMGRISFAFYLVHGPVMWTLGDRLYAATGWIKESHALGIPDWVNLFQLPRVGPLGLEFSFLIPHLIILPVTLWLAEITTKLVDKPSVKFSQWLYAKTLASSVKS